MFQKSVVTAAYSILLEWAPPGTWLMIMKNYYHLDVYKIELKQKLSLLLHSLDLDLFFFPSLCSHSKPENQYMNAHVLHSACPKTLFWVRPSLSQDYFCT